MDGSKRTVGAAGVRAFDPERDYTNAEMPVSCCPMTS